MASEPLKVFISYNRADRDWAEWIAGVIERGGYQPIIQAWDFRPGQNFVLRMQEVMADSDLTIAVLSEHYLQAEFTQSEWAAAFARDPTGKKRKLIPVRVAKCHLPSILSEIIYIDLGDRPEQDAERALLDGLKPSGKPGQPRPFPGKRAEPSISTAPFPPSLARLHGVPMLPPHHLPREADLAGLKQKLLAGVANVGVQGMGGIGKTVLAAALARDSEVRQAFPGGIYWLTAGQKPNLVALQNQLLCQFTGSKETLTTEQEAKDALREVLEDRSALVVVDDVWTIDDADAFFVTAPPARLLITTRNNEVLVGLGAEEHHVDVLSLGDALKMLAEWVGQKSPDKLSQEAAEVAKECGYLPLALAMVGAMVRRSKQPPAIAWQDTLDSLRASDLEEIKRSFPGYPYQNLLRAIEVSVEALDDSGRERYLDLAVFAEDQPIPETTLRVLWKLDARRTRKCMDAFAERSLATIAAEAPSAGATSTLNLHDLQRDLIHKRRENGLPGLHLRLLEAWDALPKLPDAYAWRWIAYHLVEAGRKDDLRRLLLDFNYLEAKLTATDTNALIADYDYLPENKDLQLLQSAIRLSAHVVARDARQLPGQLLGRLLVNRTPSIQALVNQAAEWKASPWLRPLNPSLTAPRGPLIRTFKDHTDYVSGVATTADGRRVVSASYDRTLRVWDLKSGQTLRTLKGHKGRVCAVAVTPDGHRAVSASEDQTLRLWDLETGQTLRTLEGHTDWVKAVAVTPDGHRAISGSSDCTLRLWDLESGQTLRTLEQHSDSVRAVAVTPDGHRAVSGSSDCTLRLWDLKSGQTLRTLEGHKGRVCAVAVTRDGHRAVSGSEDCTLQVWDLESGQTLRVLEGHTSTVEAVAVTPDGHRAISGGLNRTLRLWDLGSGQTLRTLEGHMDTVMAVAVTPDGHRAVSASEDQTLRLWDLEVGQTLQVLEGHTKAVTAVGFAPDGRRAVSGSEDCTLQVWDLESGQILRTLKGHTDIVWAVAVTLDSRRALSASRDRTLRVWDLESGQTVCKLEGHTDEVRAVAVTPDGHRAVSGSSDCTLRLWDLESGQTLRTLEGHTDSVMAVAVTPDGHRAVSASSDKTLRLWDLETGQTLRTLEGHTDWVKAVVVTPDGHRAISGSSDCTLRLWDLESGQTLRTLEGHTNLDPVDAVAVTHDGHRSVSASGYRTLRVWDLENGRTLRTLEGHTDWVMAVALTPNGRLAISASKDGVLRLWDLESGKEIATFTGESPMGTRSCAIAPDGHTIIGGDLSGRVHLLRLVEADKTKPEIGDAKIQLLHRKEQARSATDS